jgi:hypothetical protein
VRSIVFSVPLREQGTELVMQEAERLVGPLSGIYGKSKRLLGFEAIKVWVQTSPEGARLNLYLESRVSINDTIEAGLASTDPIDVELKRLFEVATGTTWDDVVGRWVIQILDWTADPVNARIDQEEEGS